MLSRVTLVEYLNYNLSFWTFIAGPIQRFGDFRDQFESMSQASGNVSSREVLLGLNRVMFGYFRMFVMGAYLQPLAQPKTFLAQPGWGHLLVLLGSFPLYMYMNFSGYCDIVVGLARCVGFRLPENFSNPYLARNMVDFWSRWHITLSQFFRDYIYFPLHIALSRRIPIMASMILVSLFSFILMGVWHGSSPSFALFGLIHGLGVVGTNLYADWLRRILGKERFRDYGRNVWIRGTAVVLCQSYVVLSFLPFQYDRIELAAIGQRLSSVVGLGWLR